MGNGLKVRRQHSSFLYKPLFSPPFLGTSLLLITFTSAQTYKNLYIRNSNLNIYFVCEKRREKTRSWESSAPSN